MSDNEKAIFTFHPKNEGDFIAGIPARDLSETDMLALSPTALREITALPEGAHRMYQPVKGAKLRPEFVTSEIPLDQVLSVVNDAGQIVNAAQPNDVTDAADDETEKG
jgi:hypothetical protein